MNNIDEWLEISVMLDGKRVPVILRLPTFADIGPFTREPLGQIEAARLSTLRLSLSHDIASLDNQSMRLSDADRIMADPPAHAAILQKRNALYERGRVAGRVWAQCPHCKTGEVRLSLLGYTTRLGAEAPYLTAADPVFLLPPSLSMDHTPGTRPDGAALATQIRFELPTSAIGMGRETLPTDGELGTIDQKREAAAWRRWAPDGVEPPEARYWWRRGNACFRAALALSVAVSRINRDGKRMPGKPTPDKITRLAAIDVYFLDALYYFTHFVDVAQHAVADECPACGKHFFPVH
jgi:hypothetical protein